MKIKTFTLLVTFAALAILSLGGCQSEGEKNAAEAKQPENQLKGSMVVPDSTVNNKGGDAGTPEKPK